jgi:hypothetical protein
MAHYDRDTLIILRKALDEAWAALPDDSKSETHKSEMAQRILKQAAWRASFCPRQRRGEANPQV